MDDIQTITIYLAFQGFDLGAKLQVFIDDKWETVSDFRHVGNKRNRMYQIVFESGYKTAFTPYEKITVKIDYP